MRFHSFALASLFTVRSGDFHATKELDGGTIPLISCGMEEQGLVGYFDIDKKSTYSHCVTVAYNGLPLTAKFHPYRFGAKDDIAVLVPKSRMRDETLCYVAASLNQQKWRYSYGRKCFREKLKRVQIRFPVREDDSIDEAAIGTYCAVGLLALLPPRQTVATTSLRPRWQECSVTSLFQIHRGDFHSIADLDPGLRITVSRVTTDNGVVGYFDPPQGARLYPAGCITISTVGGDAFIQLGEFIATDNVLICRPRRPMLPTTIVFIAFALNRQKWRYSYGRQCYLTKFKTVKLYLPEKDGHLDEYLMREVVESSTYWSFIRDRLNHGSLRVKPGS